MKTLLRPLYRVILCLHPSGFRAEFADEMLWIFDEESQNGHALPLLWDGVRSIVVQNTFRPETAHAEAVGGIYVEIDSTIPAERIAQQWLVTLSCTLSLAMFMSMMVPGVAMPLGRLLYSTVHRSSTPTVSHSNTIWKHHPEHFMSR
ncbi:MAG: hypothetical protein JSS95_07775 [Acidobacteria bacterium]|nr:hypothetical protein [Acidobacteriota bacterium]